MRAFRWAAVVTCVVTVFSLQVAAQVSVEPKVGKKGKNADTFVVRVGADQPLEISLLRVKDYPAQKMQKECQDRFFQGLQVQGSWQQAILVPGADAVVAVYDRAEKLERMGLPVFPLASIQAPGWQVTVHWVTQIDVRAFNHCHQEKAYHWWHMDLSGEDVKRVGLLLDIATPAGREWWLLEKCGDEPTTVRKLEAPGTAADLECPPAGK